MNEGGLKDHLVNLINALANLSPSRNLVSQIILAMPEEQATLYHSFPELKVSEFREVLRAMGVVFEDKVKCAQGSFAEALAKLIHMVFDWLDDEFIYFDLATDVMYRMEEVRSSLAKLTGLHVDLIPNPYLEWTKLVITRLSQVYGRDKVVRFVRSLLNKLPRSSRDHSLSILEEVGKEVGGSPAELKELCDFIACSEGSDERIYRRGSSRHPRGYVWICHCKYHLDPLLLDLFMIESYSGYIYDYVYKARHEESLKRALEGVA